MFLSLVAPGCGRLFSPSRAAAVAPRVRWNAEDYFSDTRAVAVCKAIDAQDAAEIDRLVKSGADVNVKGRGNMTPLLWAFPRGEKVFKKMLELGADPNVTFTEQHWPLCFEKGGSVTLACASGDLVVGTLHAYFPGVDLDPYLGLVLKHGGDPNIQDSDGRTPIFCLSRGIRQTLPERLRLLLDAGADINHRNRRGWTPIITCYRGGEWALCLLRAGADYRITDNDGSDAILWFENARRLLEKNLREKPAAAQQFQSDLSAAQPVRDWLTSEGVNWQAACAALESHVDFKDLPADYKHRPWLPQRPTLKRPDGGSGRKAGN